MSSSRIVLEQVPCRWSSDSEGATAVREAETVEKRVDGGWRSEDAVVSNLSDWCAQLRRIIRCLAMQALVHRHPKLVCDSICHIEPMQLRVKQVLLRATHNSRCSVHDPLQLSVTDFGALANSRLQ